MTGFDFIDNDVDTFDDGNNQTITLEECMEILDTADNFYMQNKTITNAVNRVHTYTTNIQPLPLLDKVVPITRMIGIFANDWNSQMILFGHPEFRQTFKEKMMETEDIFCNSDLEGVSELLDGIENIKHILQEIENDANEEVYDLSSDYEEPNISSDMDEIDDVDKITWSDSDDDL
jgi:hypothetical protein